MNLSIVNYECTLIELDANLFYLTIHFELVDVN